MSNLDAINDRQEKMISTNNMLRGSGGGTRTPDTRIMISVKNETKLLDIVCLHQTMSHICSHSTPGATFSRRRASSDPVVATRKQMPGRCQASWRWSNVPRRAFAATFADKP